MRPPTPSPPAGARRRDLGRLPVLPDEEPRLAALGDRLRDLRLSASLTRAECADRAEVSPRHLLRLERGERRTRASTLRRLAAVFAGDQSATGLAEELVALAGPALAVESRYWERVDRRRARRVRRRGRWPQRRSVNFLTDVPGDSASPRAGGGAW